jgi:hypothetical protein
MSSDDEEIFKWNMLDDRQFALRPGYKFSNAMTYRQMCQHINMMVQKVGSDAVRPKIRKYATIGGSKVPARVEFYCCHVVSELMGTGATLFYFEHGCPTKQSMPVHGCGSMESHVCFPKHCSKQFLA